LGLSDVGLADEVVAHDVEVRPAEDEIENVNRMQSEV